MNNIVGFRLWAFQGCRIFKIQIQNVNLSPTKTSGGQILSFKDTKDSLYRPNVGCPQSNLEIQRILPHKSKTEREKNEW